VSAVPQVTKTGPRTYVPAVGENIVGGQLVEARAGGRIGVAAAGSMKVLGVALTDAIAPEARSTEATIVNGRPLLDAATLPVNVAVAYGGDEVPVTYAAAAAFGDKLVVGATAGQVAPAAPVGTDTTVDARRVVGICSAPAGVAAGAVGLMRTV
jgi:hypothetical protein